MIAKLRVCAAWTISRVILDPDEVNENAILGLHIFFPWAGSEKEIQPVLHKLK